VKKLGQKKETVDTGKEKGRTSFGMGKDGAWIRVNSIKEEAVRKYLFPEAQGKA